MVWSDGKVKPSQGKVNWIIKDNKIKSSLGEIQMQRVLPSGSMVPRIQGRLNFTEIRLATVKKSLHRSCRTELTRQGILLP